VNENEVNPFLIGGKMEKESLLKYAEALINEGYRDKRFTLYGFNYFDPMDLLEA